MDWQNLIPTIVGGLLALLGGFIQQNRANKTAEKIRKESEKKAQELRVEQETKQKEEQIRQDKIKIIKDITGNKMALTDASIDKNTKTIFNSALNLIPVIFQDNKEIIAKHIELYEQITTPGVSGDETFYDLIVLLYKDVDFVPPTREQYIKTFII